MKKKIIEEIKSLKLDNPSDFKELKKDLKVALADMSTDEEGHSPKNQFSQNIKAKELPIINEEALNGDKYGNTPLSLAIEERNIELIRDLYKTKSDYSDSELLKNIALDMMDKSVQEQYSLTQDIFSRIYSEAKYQLDLLGEDTTEVIDAYNLD